MAVEVILDKAMSRLLMKTVIWNVFDRVWWWRTWRRRRSWTQWWGNLPKNKLELVIFYNFTSSFRLSKPFPLWHCNVIATKAYIQEKDSRLPELLIVNTTWKKNVFLILLYFYHRCLFWFVEVAKDQCRVRV